MGFEELNSDYTLSYMGIEYRLGPDQLDIKFSEKDIEKGFAEVKIQGILTGQVKSIDIELPKYAFSY